MKILNITVSCMAYYCGTIEIPNDMDFDSAIKYAQENIKNVKHGGLEHLEYSDEIMLDECYFDEDSNK